VQWRNIDEKYPPWQSVYYHFRKFQETGILDKVLKKLVELERIRVNKEPQPSFVAVDSQSVKIGSFISIETGIDGGKKVNGRKRHLAVDSLGLPMAMHVSAANCHDGTQGRELLWQLESITRLETIAADGTYRGQFEQDAELYNWKVAITQRPPTEKGFVPQSNRWQVERSFGWFNFFRRLSRDFEKTVESSVAFMQLAFITIILARMKN
jgi:transposase